MLLLSRAGNLYALSTHLLQAVVGGLFPMYTFSGCVPS
jgi:hypothetical protein